MNQPLIPIVRSSAPLINSDGGLSSNIAIYANNAENTSPTTPANQPTRVIHFRHVTQGITHSDLIDLCSAFGKVTNVLLLKNNQALVQFSDLACAMQFVQHFGGGDKNMGRHPTVRGINVYPSYSSHKELTKGSLEDGSTKFNSTSTSGNNQQLIPSNRSLSQSQQDATNDEQVKPVAQNRIILVTIHNVNQYTVNADTIYQAFHPYGTIEKIVMFNKTAGHQALVQYQRPQDAIKARQALSGLSLYSNNVCSLSVQFSNLNELTVHQNSDRARDYTKSVSTFSQGILESPQPSSSTMPTQQWLGTSVQPVSASLHSPVMMPREPEKTVLLVSNFNDKKMGSLALFNLFSCYGFVSRIKIFRSKPDHALVEFANHAMANTALTNLKGIELFGNKLSVNFSKHTHINSSTSTTQGSNDHSEDDLMKDFSKTNLNRFSRSVAFGTPGQQVNNPKSHQRYMCQPTSILHISNIDASVSDADLEKMFGSAEAVEGHRVYEHNDKRMALVKYNKVSNAAEALCTIHNNLVGGKSIKVAFSTNKL